MHILLVAPVLCLASVAQPSDAAILYRRPTVPDERVQMMLSDGLPDELAEQGWSMPSAPLCLDAVPIAPQFAEADVEGPQDGIAPSAAAQPAEDPPDAVVPAAAQPAEGLPGAVVPGAAAQPDEGPMDALVPVVAAQPAAVAAVRFVDKGGRKRTGWKAHAVVAKEPDKSLRQSAKAYIKDRKMRLLPLMPSTDNGQPTFIAKCDDCRPRCSKQYCFKVTSPEGGANQLCVEVKGECGDGDDQEGNIKRRKLEHAREHSQKASKPSNVHDILRAAGVPDTEWPDLDQVKNQRRGPKPTQPQHYSAVCTGALNLFLQNPPSGVTILPGAVCTSEKVRIPFIVASAARFTREVNFPTFLMDFTFKTNQHGFLLGAIEPVALWQEAGSGEPHQRFCQL